MHRKPATDELTAYPRHMSFLSEITLSSKLYNWHESSFWHIRLQHLENVTLSRESGGTLERKQLLFLKAYSDR